MFSDYLLTISASGIHAIQSHLSPSESRRKTTNWRISYSPAKGSGNYGCNLCRRVTVRRIRSAEEARDPRAQVQSVEVSEEAVLGKILLTSP
mgnify:CR=1 FL=1